MFSCITSGTLSGLESHIINVEVDVSPGLPCFQMGGLLGNEVRESRERVRVALKNTGFSLPAMCININLSPADIRKEGTAFDLPIAVGVLASLGEIDPTATEGIIFVGELGLNGELKPVRGVLPIVKKAAESGIRKIILPESNAGEGSVIPGVTILGADSLADVITYLLSDHGENQEPAPLKRALPLSIDELLSGSESSADEDFADVYGQTAVKRAAQVAAAGFHHLLMIGPPGSGKTMIARRIPGIMPPLTADESLEVTSIYSVAGMLNSRSPVMIKRPFLSPHHTVTETALTGGGRVPHPGLISLSHRGVLFLDEMTEFSRQTLDVMRQPLEEGTVFISRTCGTYRYPADFMLVAACNPCPCGYYPDRNKCSCSENQVKSYINRISGPLLDRIDICCDVDPVSIPSLNTSQKDTGMNSLQMREQVMEARARQAKRFKDLPIRFNSDMGGREIEQFCRLNTECLDMMESVCDSMGLSLRSYHRVLKVARTVADLEGSDDICMEHLAEAVCYRANGARYWGR